MKSFIRTFVLLGFIYYSASCTVIDFITAKPTTVNNSRVRTTSNTSTTTVATTTKTEASKPTVKVEEPKKIGSKSVATRKEAVSFGKQFLGTKYVYAGKTPQSGFDCSGFTSYVMKEVGVNLSPSSRTQAVQGKKIDAKKVKSGDLMIFGNNGKINHVALVVDNTSEGIKVIHSTSRGVVIDNISKSTYWKPRIMHGVDVIDQ